MAPVVRTIIVQTGGGNREINYQMDPNGKIGILGTDNQEDAALLQETFCRNCGAQQRGRILLEQTGRTNLCGTGNCHLVIA